MIDHHALHADEIEAVEQRIDKRLAHTVEMMQQLKADHEVIKTDNEDHENRLTVLEEPYYRKIDTIKIYEEFHVPMFGDNLNKG